MAACSQRPGCCDHRSEAGGFRQPTLLSVVCRLEKRGPLRAVQRRSQEAAGTRELIRFCPSNIGDFSHLLGLRQFIGDPSDRNLVF